MEEKQTDEQKDHPGPSTERGVGRTRKKNARTKLPNAITQETFQTLTLKLRNTYRNPRRKIKISRRRKHQEPPKEKTQIPRRRKGREQPKE